METTDSKIQPPMSLEEFEQLSPEEQAEQIRKTIENITPEDILDSVNAIIQEYKNQATIPTEEQVCDKFWKEHTLEEVSAVPNEKRLKWLYDIFREYYEEGASGFWDWQDNDKRTRAAVKTANDIYFMSLATEIAKKMKAEPVEA